MTCIKGTIMGHTRNSGTVLILLFYNMCINWFYSRVDWTKGLHLRLFSAGSDQCKIELTCLMGLGGTIFQLEMMLLGTC